MVAEGIGGQASGAVARQRRATLLVIYIIQFVCLFVCLFAFGAKTTEQNATKLTGLIKWGSRSILRGLKSSVLQFLERYPSISGCSFAADGPFINYCSLTFGYRAV